MKGSLLLYKDLVDKITTDDKYNKVFFEKLEDRVGKIPITFIRDYLGDKQAIEFLDILSGIQIKFPNDKELQDYILGTQVILYYDSIGRDEGNLNFVAKKFGIGKVKARKLLEMFDENYDKNKEKTFAEIEDEEEFGKDCSYKDDEDGIDEFVDDFEDEFLEDEDFED